MECSPVYLSHCFPVQGEWRLHRNVGDTVDCILEGGSRCAERRSYGGEDGAKMVVSFETRHAAQMAAADSPGSGLMELMQQGMLGGARPLQHRLFRRSSSPRPIDGPNGAALQGGAATFVTFAQLAQR